MKSMVIILLARAQNLFSEDHLMYKKNMEYNLLGTIYLFHQLWIIYEL